MSFFSHKHSKYFHICSLNWDEKKRRMYFYSVFDALSNGITLATLQGVSRAHMRSRCTAAGWDCAHTTRYLKGQVPGKLPPKKNMLCNFEMRIFWKKTKWYSHTSEKVKTGLKCENCRFLPLKRNYFALNQVEEKRVHTFLLSFWSSFDWYYFRSTILKKKFFEKFFNNF